MSKVQLFFITQPALCGGRAGRKTLWIPCRNRPKKIKPMRANAKTNLKHSKKTFILILNLGLCRQIPQICPAPPARRRAQAVKLIYC
jgi:hypothetical protein